VDRLARQLRFLEYVNNGFYELILTFRELSDSDIVWKVASAVGDHFGTSFEGLFNSYLRFYKSNDLVEGLSS